MFAAEYPCYLGGEALQPNHDLAVTNKYSGEEVARVPLADTALVARAIAAAAEAAPAVAALPAHRRRDALLHCVARFEARADELARILCLEAGKPIQHARGEVGRLIDTFRVAGGEAERLHGEVLRLDITPRADNYRGMVQRVPVGACGFISPFNFPLNLVAHKIAPAIAAGCPFVLKPASRTPIGALVIGEVLAELADWPAGAFSILPASREAADLLVTDARIKLLSFTGSDAVGWDMKARAGKKRVTLELGGNAAVVVDADTDLEDAVARILFGAFYQSGQSCISVQRILVHQTVYAECRERLVAGAQQLVVGDPLEEDTFLGPLISESKAEELVAQVASAQEQGARLLCGGTREGALMEATLLEEVPADHPLVAEEAFGPVAVLSAFEDFDAALAAVNASRFGLQAGVFTRDLYKAQRAWDVLEVGGVLVGDVPSWRVDHMPYGGVKDSGFGREGLRYAMEEMTEPRLLVIRTPG